MEGSLLSFDLLQEIQHQDSNQIQSPHKFGVVDNLKKTMFTTLVNNALSNAQAVPISYTTC
jgi:hypothetical protein